MAETANQSVSTNTFESTICAFCKSWYKDPRRLDCAHIFCLACIQVLQKDNSVVTCPLCQAEIKPDREVPSLSADNFTAQLVCLVQQHSQITNQKAGFSEDKHNIPKPIVVRLNPFPKPEASKLQNESKEAQQLGEQPQRSAATVNPSTAKVSDNCEQQVEMDEEISNFSALLNHMGDSSNTFATLFMGHMGDLMQSLQSQAKSSKTDSLVHNGINCDHCGKSGFSGERYKCGMCVDFDLCQECFPRHQEFHDRTHLFILLKRRAIKMGSPGRIINMHARAMYAQCVAEESKTHTNITCDGCGNKPIVGHRLKCG